MRRRFLWFCCKHRSLKDTSGHFLSYEHGDLNIGVIINVCDHGSVWLMFPWIVAMQQECIIVLKAAAFVSFRGCLFQRGTCLWRTVYL